MFRPDFSKGTVHIEMGLTTVDHQGKPSTIEIKNIGYVADFNLDEGVCKLACYYSTLNEPLPFFAVLSANQQKQVYAIGYRIPVRDWEAFKLGQ